MALHLRLSYLLLLGSSLISCAGGARILMLPYPWMSVVNEVAAIADELLSRKHDVYMVIGHNYPMDKFLKTENEIKFIKYKQTHTDLLANLDFDPEDFFNEHLAGKTPIMDMRVGYEGMLNGCKNILEDEKMYDRIRELEFDLVLLTAVLCSRCLYIVPYRLGLPSVSTTTDLEPWLMRNPSLPSFVPWQMQHTPLPVDMNFWQRVTNVKEMVLWVYYTDQVPMASTELVAEYAPDMPVVSMNYLAGQSLLWLLDVDIIIDYPKPMMPNEVNIGGLTTQLPKALPDELEKFVSAAKQGVVVVSFGSAPAIPRSHMLRILDGLKMLSKDVGIVLRWHVPNPPETPPNILLQSYIPQNDLLGHPNTKVFMTHVGANSQFEALFHGVPMLNFPVVCDQHYNAKRADDKGFSLSIDYNNYTSQDIYGSVTELLNNNSYKESIKCASAIFRAQPMSPRERAAFWVEHVIEFGGKHLRAHALDMPAYQYLMLDILFVVLGCGGLGSYALYLLFVFSKSLLVFDIQSIRREDGI